MGLIGGSPWGRGAVAAAAGAGDCALVARFSGDGRGGVLWMAPRIARPGVPAACGGRGGGDGGGGGRESTGGGG